jgi:hypothetical protein
MNTLRQAGPGVWVITFPTREDVTAKASEPLVPPLIEASKAGPIVLVAIPPADLRIVEPSMSAFWLEAMTRRGVQVRAIGVVTRSFAVRSVVIAFGLAMKMAGKPFAADTFASEDAAVAWASTLP